MKHRFDKLASFLLSQGLGELASAQVIGNLAALCRAADKRQVDLAPQDKLDRDELLSAAQDVLQEQHLGPNVNSPTFGIDNVRVVPVSSAQHLRSNSAGTIRPTDWPPHGVSSFGVSALLYLHYAADVPVDVFSAVHQAMHTLLLQDLRYARLPDGGLLGSEWIVPWTTISDSVLFYVAYEVAGLKPTAEKLGRFVRSMPQVLAFGFTLDEHGNGPLGELIDIAGD